jgi:hypothetical protein
MWRLWRPPPAPLPAYLDIRVGQSGQRAKHVPIRQVDGAYHGDGHIAAVGQLLGLAVGARVLARPRAAKVAQAGEEQE